MALTSLTPVLNVASVPASLAWFEALGWERSFTWNAEGIISQAADANDHGHAGFAGLRSGKVELFLCEDGQGPRGTPQPAPEGQPASDGVWMSWWLDSRASFDDLHARALKLGCTIPSPPRDEPWGCREFHLRHPDGHMFRVSVGADC